jgi:hypothetical protein
MCTPDRVCHCNHQPLVTRKVHEHVWPPPQAPHEEARGRRSESQEVTTSTYIARGAIHLNAARKRVSERARECHWRCELVVCARSDLACTDGAEVATRSYGSEQAASTGRHLCSTLTAFLSFAANCHTNIARQKERFGLRGRVDLASAITGLGSLAPRCGGFQTIYHHCSTCLYKSSGTFSDTRSRMVHTTNLQINPNIFPAEF